MVFSAAPVLDAGPAPSLGPITEGGVPVGAVGILVSDLIDAGGPLRNFSDADGDLPGIAITGVNLQGGRLWYSIDAGARWREIASVSDVFATLLWADGDTRLHVTAAGGFAGTIDDVITFRAWDRTGGFANGATGVNTQIDDPLVGFCDTPGLASGVALSADGQHAYVADGSTGLQVIDVRDPTAPVRVGGYNTSGSARAVALSPNGRYAYVADGSAGLQVIDLLDSVSPTRVGGYNTTGSAVGVVLSPNGRYAYVADSAAGLQVIDVLNPAAPAWAGGYDTNGSAVGVTLSADGRYAYLADDDAGLQVIDVLNAAAPIRVGGYDTSGFASGVTLSADGRHAYVADLDAGLQVIDVHDPAAPVRVGQCATSGLAASGITLSPDGRRAFVADDMAGLQVIDVSAPTTPVVVGGYDTTGTALGVALSADGRYAYVADDAAGLQVIDVLNTASRAVTGTCDTDGVPSELALSSNGRYAYVANSTGNLQVIDLLDPAAPVSVGGCDTLGFAFGVAIAPNGRHAYVADFDAGLRVIDILDPTAPVVVGGYDTSGFSRGVAISPDGRYAYVADDAAGLQVIDVLDPATPVRVGGYNTTGNAYGVKLSPDGRFAYVADATAGLQVIDVMIPASPVRVGGCDTSGNAWDVTLSTDGRYAYVADYGAGMHVIDLSDPAAPVRVGGYDTSGFAVGVTLSPDGRHAFLADDDAGLQVIDVVHPAAPLRVGGYDTGGFASGVKLSLDGRYAYVVDDSSGLQVIDATIGRPHFSTARATVAAIVSKRPTAITLSTSTVGENMPGGTVVGSFSTTDPDPDSGDSFSYALVPGADDTDNGLFAIVDRELRTRQAFDHESRSSYSVRLRSTDRSGLFLDKAFTITVTDANEAPTLLSLSATSVGENRPSGTAVGTFGTADPDAGNSFTYTLVPGSGSTDNGALTIDGATLKTASSFNFESKNSYSIRVRSTDQGGQFTESTFTILVTDAADEPLVVEAITPPPARSYKAGETARFLVRLSEAATVTGRPMLEFRVGAAARKAAYVGGSGTSTLAFEYVLGTKDSAEQVSLGSKLFLSKTITIAAAGEPLPAALPGPIVAAVASGVRFDTVPPKAVGSVRPPPNGSYATGQPLDFVVTFSEAVYVNGPGVPRITINGMMGGTRQAVYVSGSGTTQLTFRYVMQAGDAVAGKQGISLAKSIAVDGGAITDRDGKNPAVLGIKAPKLSGIVLAVGP